MVRLALRAPRAERMMLVSDAMPTVGSDASEFMLQGRVIRVADGRCVYEDGTLAGAHLTMAQGVAHIVQQVGAGSVRASHMASTAPAEFLGLASTHGQIAVGMNADLAWLDSKFQPVRTFIGGEALVSSEPSRSAAHAR